MKLGTGHDFSLGSLLSPSLEILDWQQDYFHPVPAKRKYLCIKHHIQIRRLVNMFVSKLTLETGDDSCKWFGCNPFKISQLCLEFSFCWECGGIHAFFCMITLFTSFLYLTRDLPFGHCSAVTTLVTSSQLFVSYNNLGYTNRLADR